MEKSNPLSTKGKLDIPHWIALALEQAQRAQELLEVPVGAVVVHQGRVVGQGYNRRECDQNPVAHAEIIAIQEAARILGSWRLNECSLVVTLEPCPMCLAACQQARMSEVFYGATDPKGGALSLNYRLHEDIRTHHRFPVKLYETQACQTILKEFFKKRRAEKKA